MRSLVGRSNLGREHSAPRVRCQKEEQKDRVRRLCAQDEDVAGAGWVGPVRDQADPPLARAADARARDQDVVLPDGRVFEPVVGPLVAALDRRVVVARRHELARLVVLVGQAGAFRLAARRAHVVADDQAAPAVDQLAERA